MISAGMSLNTSLFRAGERIAVAVSGGADSTALLLAMLERRVELGLGVSAVHLHHGLRGAEADGDRDFVVELCARMEVALRVEHVDVAAAARANRETLEEAARSARLAFFQKVVASGEATAVATAHTLNDQAETVMAKLLRGAWTEGIGAIHPVLEMAGGCVIRPMLHLKREAVEAFLRARGQSWREDSSNASMEHTRNRIRRDLMPMLRSFNPQIDSALANVAELAREEEARWGVEIDRLLPQLLLPGKPVRGGGRAVGTQLGEQSYAIEIERLRPLEMATRRRILRAAVKRMGLSVSASDTLRLLRICGLAPKTSIPDGTVSAKVGSKLSLGSGLQAERSARELRLTRRDS